MTQSAPAMYMRPGFPSSSSSSEEGGEMIEQYRGVSRNMMIAEERNIVSRKLRCLKYGSFRGRRISSIAGVRRIRTSIDQGNRSRRRKRIEMRGCMLRTIPHLRERRR